MTKLTERQIVQIHTMSAAGASNQEICRALRLNRNSVSSHLAGDITYPDALYRKLSMKAALAVGEEWLDMRQAAPWIPGHPSRARMQVIISGRSFSGKRKPRLRTELRGSKRYTKLEWIADFLALIYPTGIWVSYDALFNTVPLDTIEKIPLVRLGWIKGTEEPFGFQIRACRLCVAARAAANDGHPLDVSPVAIHRASTLLAHVGVAVL